MLDALSSVGALVMGGSGTEVPPAGEVIVLVRDLRCLDFRFLVLLTTGFVIAEGRGANWLGSEAYKFCQNVKVSIAL